MRIAVSCYLLTHNSERRLQEVLSSVEGVADEVIIVDSGSTDATKDIAAGFGARVIYRRFDDFTAQRTFAVAQCRNDWVLSIDSDEVLSPSLAETLRRWKDSFDASIPGAPDAFGIRREWYALGRRVRCFYPSTCPDFPIRLFRKGSATYTPNRSVHENMSRFARAEVINEPLLHYTCDSVDQLYGKVNLYTTLAAADLRKTRRPSHLRIAIMPAAIWFKWYVVNGGWRDGMVGAILGRYVYDTVYQKLIKARYDHA
jgi:glycosyltransferase involved in cell wall biosynthesis